MCLTDLHNLIKGIGDQPDDQPVLPYGIAPVTRGTVNDLERLKTEVALIWTADCKKDFSYPWGRESFFTSRSGSGLGKRVLLRYSVNAAGRIVRGWYLTLADCRRNSPYRFEAACPIEAAWLETICVAKPSEPAWLYLRPASHSLTPSNP